MSTEILEQGCLGKILPKVIKGTGLDGTRPFERLPYDSIRCAFKYQVGKLVRAGRIEAPYSVHDLRHFFAIQEYLKDNNILRIKVMHVSCIDNENYLQESINIGRN